MIKIKYSLPDLSKNETHVTGTANGVIISFPAFFNEDGTLNLYKIKDKITTLEINLTLNAVREKNPRYKFSFDYVDRKDTVYVNQQIVRYDYNLDYPEAKPLLDQLKLHFEDQISEDIETHDAISCIIGTNTNYRPPYENSVISWYKFGPMPQKIVEQFSVDVENYDLLPWYGRKFDTSNGSVRLKIVFKENDNLPKPNLPLGIPFYSKLYNQDGSVEPYIDCYLWTDASIMKEFCSNHNVPFPAPADVEDNISLWGIVYHVDTLEVLVVKAYEFYS